MVNIKTGVITIDHPKIEYTCEEIYYKNEFDGDKKIIITPKSDKNFLRECQFIKGWKQRCDWLRKREINK